MGQVLGWQVQQNVTQGQATQQNFNGQLLQQNTQNQQINKLQTISEAS